MKNRMLDGKEKQSIVKLLKRDRNEQIDILDCIEGLNKDERDLLLANDEFLPYFTSGEHSQSRYYVSDEAEVFVCEAIKQFLIQRKLPDDISQVNILKLLSILFSRDHTTSFTEYRDIILNVSYTEFRKLTQERKEFLHKLHEKYKNYYNQNRELYQNVQHQYQKMLIKNNMDSLTKLKKASEEQLKENKLISHVSWKLSKFNVRQYDFLNNDPYFAPAELYSPKILDQRFRWMLHLPPAEYFKLLSTNDISVLEKDIPASMNYLEEYLKDNEFNLEVKIHVEAIVEAIDSYKMGFKRAAITLMLRENEGLVWDLARQIADKNNISFSKEKKQIKIEQSASPKNISSLPMLLAITEWPKIFKDPLKEGGKLRLGERLGYLSIDYSHERNLIVHGISDDYYSNWKWFELLSACVDILQAFEELEEEN
ncbi:hypothetical protein [Paenibacillus sp. FSL H7-689]|uniref:hypothetical protein n=1 Tax=Paenibacillus sp. FSL H7-689 TaxID=1227349 RepID=UPI0003E26795|nr:hypothetical protein [Paenibacillus sp. FSL H7-689]ETT56078.1 hypothetical protein C170_01284 [Paenibacillus sp. FSL H7-689]